MQQCGCLLLARGVRGVSHMEVGGARYKNRRTVENKEVEGLRFREARGLRSREVQGLWCREVQKDKV